MKQSNRLSFLTLYSVTALLLAGLLLATYSLQTNRALAQTTSGITLPAPGDSVSGVVSIVGTAVGGNFQRYELYYKPSEANDAAYVYISQAEEEVVDNELDRWDTIDLEPGLYDLRLRVVRLDGNYSEYFAPGLRVGVTAAPTATLTDTASIDDTSTPTESVAATETITETATVTPAR